MVACVQILLMGLWPKTSTTMYMKWILIKYSNMQACVELVRFLEYLS